MTIRLGCDAPSEQAPYIWVIAFTPPATPEVVAQKFAKLTAPVSLAAVTAVPPAAPPTVPIDHSKVPNLAFQKSLVPSL